MKRLLALGALMLSLVCTEAWAATAHVGTVVSSTGTVVLQRTGKRYKLPEGTKVYNGDSVVTGKGAFAKILLADDSLLTINESSAFRLEGFETSDQQRSGRFRLYFGKMRAVVSKFLSGNTDYKFQTPTAVAGVRGTHFVLEFDKNAQQTTLSVVEGQVAFNAVDERIGTPVLVGASQRSEQRSRSAPSEAREMTDQERQSVNEEIASTQTPPEGTGESQGEGGERQEESASTGSDGDAGGGDAGEGDSENDGEDTGDEASGEGGNDEGANEDGASHNDAGDESAQETPEQPADGGVIERTETVQQEVPREVERNLPTDSPVADPSVNPTGIRVRW